MSVQSTRREQRRDQLLDCALELFGEVGFERATIKTLATRAGVSQGLLYHYFQGKEELIAAVMDRYSLLPQLAELYESTRDLPASVALPRLATRSFELFWEQKEVCWLFFREVKNPAIAGPMQAMTVENIRLLADYLESRVRAGELRPHDCTVVARTFLSAIFLLTIVPPVAGETPAPEMLARMSELLLEGMVAR